MFAWSTPTNLKHRSILFFLHSRTSPSTNPNTAATRRAPFDDDDGDRLKCYGDYFIRRLGFMDHLCFELLTRCEPILLSVLPDSRFMSYLPSELATATVLHVVNSVEPHLGSEHQSHLFGILGINKAKVNECWKVIFEVWSGLEQGKQCIKCKFGSIPGTGNNICSLVFLR